MSFLQSPDVIYSPTRATFSANLILFGLIFVLVSGKEYKWSSSWCGLPWFPFAFNDLDSSNSLSAIFSLFVFPLIRETESHIYIFRTTRKIIIIYILMCACLDSKLQDKRFRIECLEAFPELNQLLVFWVTAACRLRFCHIFSAFISCSLARRLV